jgi:hypothetical protein
MVAQQNKVEVEDRSVFDLAQVAPTSSIHYGNDPDQVIDVYLPDHPKEAMVVLIHGGYWRPEYDRLHLTPLSQKLAHEGWPVALIEYRRIPGNPDATVDDVISALAALASQYQQLILIGHSAGGHLALLAAHKSNVLGVIALAPVTDLLKTDELDLDESAVSEFLGGPASLRADLDPMQQVIEDVPITVIHGTADIWVPVVFSREYAADIKRSNVKLIELAGIGHFELIDPRHSTMDILLEELGNI